MKSNNSNYTGRHPRTMQEAFGPHTDNKIYEQVRPYDWQDKVVMVGCIVCLIVFVLVVALSAH